MSAVPNEIVLAACRFQAAVFERSATEYDCSSAVFVRRFMKSQLAETMDADPSLLAAPTPEEALRLLDQEYGPTSYGSVKYSAEVLHWMGYLLRYWAIVHGKPSKEIYRIIGARELAGLFDAYHTLSPDQAIERILESKGLGLEQDPTDRGVAELRRIRQRSRYEYFFMRLPEGLLEPETNRVE